MARMETGSVDAVVCDPPYLIEFMGRAWDKPGDVRQRGDENFQAAPDEAPFGRVRHGGTASYSADPVETGRAMQEWHFRWAREALRVLKPGGYLLAFGGTRSYHRLACAVEDAGFEIRDRILVESAEGVIAEPHPTELAWVYGSG